MGYSFLEFMKRIGIFIICAQSIMHFVAGKSYEKYVKVLIGVMVLAQFIVPVRALLLGGDNAELWDSVETFQTEMQATLDNSELEYKELEVTKSLQDEIKEKLENTANKYGYTVKETLIHEKSSTLEILLSTIVNKSNEPIKINKIDINISKEADEDSAKEEEKHDENKELIDKIKEEFSVCLGTDKTYIEIKME